MQAGESCYHKQTATEKEKKKEQTKNEQQQQQGKKNNNKTENVICTRKKMCLPHSFAKPFSIISHAKTVKTLPGRTYCP